MESCDRERRIWSKMSDYDTTEAMGKTLSKTNIKLKECMVPLAKPSILHS